MFAYFASLCLLEADVLFSEQKVAELLVSATNEPREPIERHHLFPQAHLESIGKKSPREKNQIANYALVEWGDNTKIGGAAPAEYLPTVEKRVSQKTLERQYYWHALPDGWASMGYDVFLRQRRELIAKVVQDAYKHLENGEANSDGTRNRDIGQLIDEGESTSTEFKSTLRRNLHTGENDIKIENAALKTIAAFLNSKGGGTLFLGVADDGEPLGLENDAFANQDKMLLHLNNLVKERLGSKHFLYIQPHFDDLEGKSVLVVDCLAARSPAYLKEGSEERFYIRSVAATVELKGSQIQDYVALRFR